MPYLPNMGFSRDIRAQAAQRHGKIKRQRLKVKQDYTPFNWAQAWAEYIRADVVSKHAARNVNFLGEFVQPQRQHAIDRQ